MSLLRDTVEAVTPLDHVAVGEAQSRQDSLTKPPGSLGRLETLAAALAGMQGSPRPEPDPFALVLAAADHGVTAEGVSAYPSAVTAQMMENFLAGGAAINNIARSVGIDLFLVDAGVDADFAAREGMYVEKVARGTANFAQGPAMSAAEAEAIVSAGIRFAAGLHERGFRALGLGDMGIGNTTSAAAVAATVTGAPVPEVTGRGTMIDDHRLRHKTEVIERALERQRPDAGDGMAVLAAVGGFEIGFLAGCALGAAARRMPVIVDGFPTSAAVLIADRLCRAVREYCVAGHQSLEPGHGRVLAFLGLTPLLTLDMRLGEGTGAALSVPVVRAACRCLAGMATFEEAAVQNRGD